DATEADRAVQAQAGHPGGQKSQRLLKLGSGEIGAKAVMRASPESQQPAVAPSGDVEPLPVFTLTVAAFSANGNERAGRESDALILDILQTDSCREGGHWFDPQHLCHRGWNKLRGGAEQVPLVGVLSKQVQSVGELTLGGVDRAGQDVDGEIDALH